MRQAELAYLETLVAKLESILAQKVPVELDHPVDIFEARVDMFTNDLNNFKSGIECHIEIYNKE